MCAKIKLILLLLYSSLILSMENNEDNQLNWLAVLPIEMHDKIARYVSFPDKENDEELIERTKNLKQGDYYTPVTYNNFQACIEIKKPWLYFNNTEYLIVKNLITNTQQEVCEKLRRKNWLMKELVPWLFSFSPDCSKLISSCEEDLSLFDVEKGVTIFSKPSIMKEKSSAEYIAISNDGNLMAELIPLNDRCSCLLGSYYTLKIKNIHENTYFFESTQKLLSVQSIAFNKQRTKVILHAKKFKAVYANNASNNDYEIICFNKDREKELKRKSLIDYFRQKGICKNLISSE